MFAHSPNERGEWHDLAGHLIGTAERAAAFSTTFGATELGRLAGLWHDVGKCHPEWQAYLQGSAAGRRRRGSGGDHKAAGASLARHLPPVAFAIAGHHGGLPSFRHTNAGGSYRSLAQLLHDEAERAEQAIAEARRTLDGLDGLDGGEGAVTPAHISSSLEADLFTRLLFSALVDADFLDTEAHFQPDRSGARADALPSIETLRATFEADHERLMAQAAPSAVNDARADVYRAALDAAERPPGLFRLTVPTGGGKTRAALAFALRHAERHGMQRVILAVPFISITEQTAQTYRDIFGAPGFETALLEHHSGVEEPPDHEHDDDAQGDALWARLASENWDARVVVTTTVQLFESLFGRKPSRMRKVHRLAGSVIVLDEAQALPPKLLEPTLHVLRGLVQHYGASVVLSTATQPAFDEINAFREVDAVEIVPEPVRHFTTLERVEYDLRHDQGVRWDELAGELAAEHQALAIVNTKADALALLDALTAVGTDDALHLSTLLCGEHRRDTIETVRARLAGGERCIVVSTQVVEAGVDLDFPAVFRAFGPLDSIVQAAGRCNREGAGERGRVVVFQPAEGTALPGGSYRTATDAARTSLNAFPGRRPDNLEVLRHYFRLLYGSTDPDGERVQAAREALDFPLVAERYRLIDDDTVPVVVTEYTNALIDVSAVLERLRTGAPDVRHLYRRLQPYTVALRRRQWQEAVRQGLVREVVPGLGEWLGDYDGVQGLTTPAPLRPADLIV